MEDFMSEVNKRTNLAFSNQMEMLTFNLTDSQQYGINVFKIIEVIETPKKITKMPQSHPAVVGAIDFRERAVSVIDLALGLGLPPVNREGVSYIIICEYSNSTQGFLITNPNKLLTRSWDDIKSPTGTFHNAAYLTAIAYEDDGTAIQILDVEKVLGEIIGIDDQIAESLLKSANLDKLKGRNILVVDDSRAARTLLQSTLTQLGVQHALFDSAIKALEHLESGQSTYDLIISDIEMPGMDGFTFTRKVKANPKLAGVHLVLHSSLSNQSNRDKATLVGADGFIAKFQPDEVARVVLDNIITH